MRGHGGKSKKQKNNIILRGIYGYLKGGQREFSSENPEREKFLLCARRVVYYAFLIVSGQLHYLLATYICSTYR